MKTWNGIHEILNNRPNETNYVTSLEFDNTTITALKSIANLFNNPFTSIAKKIKQQLIASKSKYSDDLNNACQ